MTDARKAAEEYAESIVTQAKYKEDKRGRARWNFLDSGEIELLLIRAWEAGHAAGYKAALSWVLNEIPLHVDDGPFGLGYLYEAIEAKLRGEASETEQRLSGKASEEEK